ncbi:MAG: substrate-binding domain-containing protein [Spirochaetes bacterium]|nr:substrate-binding domain-containing protein [Spirochaetota bacterium]
MKILIYLVKPYDRPLPMADALQRTVYDHTLFDVLVRGCFRRGWDCCVYRKSGWKDFTDDVARENPDAVITDITLPVRSSRVHLETIARRMPFVCMAPAPDTAADGGPFISANFSEETAVNLLVRHLKYEGYTRIGFAGFSAQISATRFNLVRQTLASLKLSPPRRAYHVPETGWLDDAGRPQALICVNDQAAMIVYDQLTARGLHVPDDIALCGIDGITADSPYRHITTVCFDFNLLAASALDLAEQHMHFNGGNAPSLVRRVVIQPRFRLGTSSLLRSRGLTKRKQDFLQTALTMLEKHFRDPDCQARACEAAGVGRTHFQRQFFQLTGSSFTRRLLEMRLDFLGTQLLKTGRPAADIAEEAGLKASGYLFRAFRARFGLTPDEYRRKAAGKEFPSPVDIKKR